MHSLDPTTAANITTKATAFAQSYGAAMNTSLDPSTTLESCAASLAAHYSPHFTAFALGAPPAKVAEGYASNTSSTPSGAAEASPHDKMTASVATHLRRFDAVGLGWAVKLVGFDVQPYAAGAAVVWMTWESVPREGCSVAGWQWTNVYGYRVAVGGGDEDKGCWEYALSDQEIGRLLERFPNFFTVEI